MIEDRATRILNLLGIMGSRGLNSTADIPTDLQNPWVTKYLDLYASVYATANKSDYKITLQSEEKLHGDQLRLAASAKFLFSDEVKDSMQSLQTELIEAKVLGILKGQQSNIAVSKHATKRIKYIDRGIKGRTQQVSLSNLRNILDLKLAKEITKNMGDGDSKTILNYQSGRFANTVQVNRLLIGRDGAINIFYTYMKYPYQTFEPGFEQGHINSRDPKRLIAKSIRDIAATLVANELKVIRV